MDENPFEAIEGQLNLIADLKTISEGVAALRKEVAFWKARASRLEGDLKSLNQDWSALVEENAALREQLAQ